MKKIYSYTEIVENYQWEFMKESCVTFLAHVGSEIKNKLQDNKNVQFVIKEKDNQFTITCENEKVCLDEQRGLHYIKGVMVEYRYENKVCIRAVVKVYC